MGEPTPAEIMAKSAWEYRRAELTKEEPTNILPPFEELSKSDREWMANEQRAALRALADMKL